MKANGFTLVEMLIAIAIFAMLATSGAALLQGSVTAQDITRQRLEGLAGDERLSAMLANELGQALARPTRDAAGAPEAAFEGGGDVLLSYVRAGRSNPTEAARSGVERVTWRVVQGRLERIARTQPDGGAYSPPAAILDGLTSASIRFRDGADWRDVWDPADPSNYPSAIELTVTREGRATIVRKLLVRGRRMTPRASERGVALLTVLAIVAIMSVIAASAIERVKIATRLTTNNAAADQARAYAHAAEAIALSRIADLFPPDRSTTTLAGDWNGRPLPYPIDGGSATVTLSDAGNCFNLNSLVQGGVGQPQSFRPAGLAQFEALLLHLGVGLDQSRPVGLAIADWIDTDSAPLPGGAEDGAYPDFRTANSLMVDASEVRVMRGMTPDLYRLIRPWLCALPVTDLSPINVNTIAPAQAPLIAMLVPTGLDVRGATALIQARPLNGFESTDAFWLQLRGGVVPAAEARAQTKVKTVWFGLETDVTLAGSDHRASALIDAAKAPAKIVRRAYGDPV